MDTTQQDTKTTQRALVMAPNTVQLSNWELQGRTMTILDGEVPMKYLGNQWWEM